MKKLIKQLLRSVFGATVFICIACPGSLMAKDVLLVNTYPSVAYMNDQGKVDGPVAALIREVCQRMGQQVEFSFNPIQRMFKVLENHEADAAFNMSHNRERAERWHYSKPVHRVYYSVFTQKSDPLNYQDRKDLAGYTIATYGPTNMSKKVKKFAAQIPGAKVDIQTQYDAIFKMLANGRYGEKAAVYAPDTVGFGVLEKYGLENKIRFAGNDKKNLYYIVFVKELVDEAFVNEFNRVLLDVYKSGKMAAIYSRYTADVKATMPSPEDMLTPPPQ